MPAIRSRIWRLAAHTGLSIFAVGIYAQDNVTTVFGPNSTASRLASPKTLGEQQKMLDYWTPERMRNAIPTPLSVPSEVTPAGGAPSSELMTLPKDLAPGYAPGWAPDSGPQPDPRVGFDIAVDETPGSALPSVAAVPPRTRTPISPPSSPTDYANYAPFNRWTHFGNGNDTDYLTYPISVIGKLFYRRAGLNWECSASVIGRNTIATAAHCLHPGDNNQASWSSGLVFCPSYYKGGPSGTGSPHPDRGCWTWTGYASVPTPWFANSSTDHDIACFVTQTRGTVHNDSVGNITGWSGRAWNGNGDKQIFAYGYPAAPPFPGYHIIVSASVEWYEIDWDANAAHKSKYIGSDMTAGASGGPWWLGIRNPNCSIEYADVDGSDATDWFQGNCSTPVIFGVNSHRRLGYTSEMGSPPFLDMPNTGADSESIFADCFNNGGA